MDIGEISSWTQNGQIVAWVGTGDPRSCLHWEERKQSLERRVASLEIVAGLRACPHCDGDRCRVRRP